MEQEITEGIEKDFKHPENCKGCPDCPAMWTCSNCGKSFHYLNTSHECKPKLFKDKD